MRYEILFSSRFKKSFSRLQDVEKKMFYEKLSLFIENHKHPSLRSKKIKGSKILFESSINMSIRIIWAYQDENLIIMLDIGHHDILKRL
ncbi:MAG: cytotoxin [Tenericutes bacterium]|nr:cytotoxin [Mycoplasmatota bacterium]